jgi:hypothetical protein
MQKGNFRNALDKGASESCALERSSEKGMTILGLVLWTSFAHKKYFFINGLRNMKRRANVHRRLQR